MKLTTILPLTTAFALLAGSTHAALIGHWKFDETSGTTAADSSGNGHTATTTGATTWIAGKDGMAANNPRFTVAAASTAALALADGTTPFTISLWAQTTVNDDFAVLAGFEGTGSTGDRYSLKVTGSGALGVEKGGAAASGLIGNLSNGNWIHLVGVNDPTGGFSRFYIDGVQSGADGSVVNLATGTDQGFTMGTYWNSNSYDYTGALDDVQIYDEALTESDITFLFNNAGTAIPEPSVFALLGLAGLALLRRRRA